MSGERRRVRVVPGEPIGRWFPSRPVIFRVEDRRFLPEAPLDFQGHNFASPVGKCLGENIGDPRPHRMATNRLLVR